jgi:pyruvate formate lyase activating enzyme
MIEASYYRRIGESAVTRCELCPHECEIEPGRRGLCGVRENVGGILYAANYEEIVSLKYEAIEEHGFYHYRPGSRVLFLGIAGESLHLDFLGEVPGVKPAEPTRWLTVSEALDHAVGKECPTIVIGHGDPLLWYEFLSDLARSAAHEGVAIALRSRGFWNPAPLDSLLPLVRAVSLTLFGIDEPGMRAGTERPTVPPLEAARRLQGRVHLEVSYALAADVNDAPDLVLETGRRIANELGRGTPLHVVGAAPAGRPDLGLATADECFEAADLFRRHLRHVYVRTDQEGEGIVTLCPECGSELVCRTPGEVTFPGMMPDGECASCGRTGVVEW